MKRGKNNKQMMVGGLFALLFSSQLAHADFFGGLEGFNIDQFFLGLTTILQNTAGATCPPIAAGVPIRLGKVSSLSVIQVGSDDVIEFRAPYAKIATIGITKPVRVRFQYLDSIDTGATPAQQLVAKKSIACSDVGQLAFSTGKSMQFNISTASDAQWLTEDINQECYYTIQQPSGLIGGSSGPTVPSECMVE